MRKKLLRSRSGFEKPESREEAIMQNILGASNVLEPPESNIEEILLSILYSTPYTKEAEFEIEKILLAIKNNGTYDGEGESRDIKILIAILKDLDYTEEAESRIEELFIEWLQQRQQIKVLEGVPPLTFISSGKPLIDYMLYGNMEQTSKPTTNNPVYPRGCGELSNNRYILPISCGGVESIINISTVSSTRRIKKLVLNGTENWLYANGVCYLTTITNYLRRPQNICLCSHYQTNDNISASSQAQSGVSWYRHTDVSRLYIKDSAFTSAAAFKSWLAEQYANNTPLTIYYILAAEETGIVNEPLCKIDTYADSLSMEQAGLTIQTVSGNNTLDVLTTVKPSIYIAYK